MRFGRLQEGPAAKPFSDINMTPLVDVMLVLLVIFLITAPLLTGAVKLDLPKAKGLHSGGVNSAVTLAINQSGQLFFNDRQMDAMGLDMALQQAARSNPDTEVQLRADTAVAYGRVVEVMALAQKAGLRKVAFVAQTGPAAP